ncbi:hypothetical protein SLEP1_g11077 [Rubroshorea leprosula]|uniref:Bet v I/Major latex protein domain-containing protein n=1 Tax=Rubroshorea leprosula TaxID=152421 RepID=A0AAV5IKY4_9ROSI|nr:hypothetical protein SLEP1_g11077 [Rubroshorea leprosula]
MALLYKSEADVETKATAEQFYRTFGTRAHQVPNAAPTRIQKVAVHQVGVAETFKEKVELDEESKTVRLVGLEGDLFNHYKSYVVTLKVIPKGQGGVVKLTYN